MNNDPIKILLVDDDEGDRLIFIEAFNEVKMLTEVNTVNDSVTLMEYLEDDSKAYPHIIFLDLNMPGKSGLECLKEIKSNKKYKDIAIAIYSTSSSENDIKNTYINGANIYIHKPNDFTTLTKLLEKAVKVAFLYQKAPFKKENFLLKL